MTTQQKREQINLWIAQKKWTVSPNQAAPILDLKNGYGFNLAAKAGHLPPHVAIMHGRNLRIYVSYLSDLVASEERALLRAGGTA